MEFIFLMLIGTPFMVLIMLPTFVAQVTSCMLMLRPLVKCLVYYNKCKAAHTTDVPRPFVHFFHLSLIGLKEALLSLNTNRITSTILKVLTFILGTGVYISLTLSISNSRIPNDPFFYDVGIYPSLLLSVYLLYYKSEITNKQIVIFFYSSLVLTALIIIVIVLRDVEGNNFSDLVCNVLLAICIAYFVVHPYIRRSAKSKNVGHAFILVMLSTLSIIINAEIIFSVFNVV